MNLILYAASALLVLVIGAVVFRVVVRRDYLKRGRLSPFSTFLEYVAMGVWAWQGYLNRPSDWPAIDVGPMAQVIGWILFAGGAALTLWLIVGLGVRRSHGRQVDTLRQSGWYGWTRNPQVVAFIVAMIGYGLLWPTWEHLGSVILAVALSHMMVRTEEEHLSDVFGKAYAEYCRRVPRYVGFSREPADAP